MTTFNDIYAETARQNGLEKYIGLHKEFEKLYVALTETNKLYNLTAVTDIKGVCSLHFCDSLLAADIPAPSARVLDIGCGAGFPSLPIAIARPDVTVHAIDSTAKKVEFSTRFANENNIENFTSQAIRAEELAKTNARESYDFVTARAVARLNVLAELALPFVKTGGTFLAMKGSIGAQEAKEAENGIKTLGGRIEKIEEKDLITDQGAQKRTFIYIKKLKPTPDLYPRAYAKILKKPL